MEMRKRERQDKKTESAVRRRRSFLAGFAGLLLLTAADQMTKLLAYGTLRVNGPVRLIPGVFELHYLQNRGAAFGMLEDRLWIFVLFALLILGAAAWFYVRLPMDRRFMWIRMICVVLSAGAAGNLIDRAVRGYVIDFFYFALINFPIFNVADIYVCVSTAALLILLLFYYKEEDFSSLQRNERNRNKK